MIDKKNILVVDNSSSMTSPWKTDIKNYYNIFEVVGGYEAISKLKNGNIALAIINLSLPSFNGIDVVIKIRNSYKSLPILVIAEKNDLRFVKNAAVYGIHGYHLMPVHSDKLMEDLQKFTGTSIAQMENEIEIERARNEQTKLDKTQNGDELNDGEVPSLYYKGQSFLLNEDVDNAMVIFNQIIGVKKMKDTWRKYVEDSLYQLGRCLYKKGQYKDSLAKADQFINRAPNSELIKHAYLLMGECYEKLNDLDKALSIYKKVADMPPLDSTSSQAKKKIKALQYI